jgi:hypothetical protein
MPGGGARNGLGLDKLLGKMMDGTETTAARNSEHRLTGQPAVDFPGESQRLPGIQRECSVRGDVCLVQFTIFISMFQHCLL